MSETALWSRLGLGPPQISQQQQSSQEPEANEARTDAGGRRLHAFVRRAIRTGYGLISYRLLNGLSNGTRRTLLKPASAHSSRTLGSWKPSVPSPAPPPASEVVMQ